MCLPRRQFITTLQFNNPEIDAVKAFTKDDPTLIPG
jgi:hypothetical protein